MLTGAVGLYANDAVLILDSLLDSHLRKAREWQCRMG